MEVVGAVPQGEWGVCSDEGELMAQLLGNCSFPNEEMNDTNFVVSPAFWATHDESNQNTGVVDDQVAMYCNDETSMCSFSQGSSYSSSILFPFSSQESYYSSSPSPSPSTLSHHLSLTNHNVMTMDYCMTEGKNVMGGDHDFLNQDVSNDSTESNDEGKNKMGLGLVVPMPRVLDKNISPSESKKRSRIPCDAPRSKKSIKFNKCPKFDESDDECNNQNNKNAAVFQRQSSGSCCSEDESNEMSCSSSKGSRGMKQRASRGSATDPQSLYARKRRERINERLRILQTLVPNGTKVDISTMLEEAVEYVKFLQLQIKLLSSDDHWMYAPIAYNGMDIGLDLKISTPTPQS